VSTAGIDLVTESFEAVDAPTYRSTIEVNPFITITDEISQIKSTTEPFFVSDGSKAIFVGNRVEGQDLIFTFAEPINAFGIDTIDLLNQGWTGETFTVTTGNGDSKILYTGPASDHAGDVLFVDVVDTGGLTEVRFMDSATGEDTAIDRLQYGPVP